MTWLEAAGWTILHSLWQGTLSALLLFATLRATRSPGVRYNAAIALSLAMAAASAITLLVLHPLSWAADSPLVQVAVSPHWPPFPGTAGSRPIGFLPWIAPLWSIGAMAILLRNALGWAHCQRLRRRGICAVTDCWTRRLADLARESGVRRTIGMFESALVDVPVVLGHLRPVILIPVGMLAGLPAGHMEAILLHELAHIRRNDYLVNLAQHLFEALYFFHPAAWWISAVARMEREHCCDDTVIALRNDRRTYAAALTGLEASRWAMAQAATGGNPMQRIQRILGYATRTKTPGAPAAAAIAAGLAALLLGLGANTTLQAWQSDSPYSKWVNEEVAYIIHDAERTAFLRLPTDEERQQFIGQFWLRRDPTPGTEANEAKNEHYRRLAYSNERFGNWRSDRGRIYITFGPPDEIESHPAAPAREDWFYKRVAGVGDEVMFHFADRDGSGELRVVPSKRAAR